MGKISSLSFFFFFKGRGHRVRLAAHLVGNGKPLKVLLTLTQCGVNRRKSGAESLRERKTGQGAVKIVQKSVTVACGGGWR